MTRRCSERRFLLRPDHEVTQIFEYLLAHLSAQHGIQLHAFVVMSNHYHLVVTDVHGVMPDFQRDLNSLLARAVNAFRGRWESLWDRRSYSGVELVEGEDVFAKMVYTLANPVEARLVNRANQWEGATSAGMVFGRARRIARPKKFFVDDNLPEVVELVLTRPDCCEDLEDGELLARVNAEVARCEDEHAKQGKAMGMARVMGQDWNSSPDSFEPRREMSPRIAAKNKWARIEAIQRSQEWLVAYYEALARFVSGERDVEFPRGTWWMRVRLGCQVALA